MEEGGGYEKEGGGRQFREGTETRFPRWCNQQTIDKRRNK